MFPLIYANRGVKTPPTIYYDLNNKHIVGFSPPKGDSECVRI